MALSVSYTFSHGTVNSTLPTVIMEFKHYIRTTSVRLTLVYIVVQVQRTCVYTIIQSASLFADETTKVCSTTPDGLFFNCDHQVRVYVYTGVHIALGCLQRKCFFYRARTPFLRFDPREKHGITIHDSSTFATHVADEMTCGNAILRRNGVDHDDSKQTGRETHVTCVYVRIEGEKHFGSHTGHESEKRFVGKILFFLKTRRNRSLTLTNSV